MYDRILIPTDGSTGSAHVALQALHLARTYDSEVYALHVVDDDISSLLVEVGPGERHLQERGEQALSVIERMAESHGLDVTTELRTGSPAPEILEYATEIEASLIVAGTHGRTGVRRHIIGSVAERLVRHAECPVMTVRLPESDVTIDTVEEARGLVEDALATSEIDGTISTVERQLNVWVARVETDDGHTVVYIDPVTRRTSVLPQDHYTGRQND